MRSAAKQTPSLSRQRRRMKPAAVARRELHPVPAIPDVDDRTVVQSVGLERVGAFIAALPLESSWRRVAHLASAVLAVWDVVLEDHLAASVGVALSRS